MNEDIVRLQAEMANLRARCASAEAALAAAWARCDDQWVEGYKAGSARRVLLGAET